MQEEIEMFRKRFSDLADQAYRQGRFTFTSFMDPAQTDLFLRQADRLSSGFCKLWGGNPYCERRIGRFGSPGELGYEQDFPISCIQISPLQKKFSDDFTHRDFLGALMNLGIRRDTLGDIFLEDREAYLFCTDTIAPFIIDNLEKVSHTSVCVQTVNGYEGAGRKDALQCEATVSSLRADGILSKLFNLSRTQSLALFREKRVFVNSRTCENNSALLKPEDMVSVRGYGRFCFIGCAGPTKKGKWRVTLLKYGKGAAVK